VPVILASESACLAGASGDRVPLFWVQWYGLADDCSLLRSLLTMMIMLRSMFSWYSNLILPFACSNSITVLCSLSLCDHGRRSSSDTQTTTLRLGGEDEEFHYGPLVVGVNLASKQADSDTHTHTHSLDLPHKHTHEGDRNAACEAAAAAGRRTDATSGDAGGSLKQLLVSGQAGRC
jgi:hypothetical protein